MFDPKLKEALSRVQKPGRYTGGEPGSVYKNKDEVDVRFAFCFPDTYEVGMSFLGEKILYELLNSHENWWCERAFMPWLDMKAEMKCTIGTLIASVGQMIPDMKRTGAEMTTTAGAAYALSLSTRATKNPKSAIAAA